MQLHFESNVLNCISDRSFLVQEFRDHTDDTTVYLDVILSEENLLMAKQEGLLKKFKLTTTISTSNMHLFDPKGAIKKYDTPEQSKPYNDNEMLNIVCNVYILRLLFK